jgi:hypothetical protein
MFSIARPETSDKDLISLFRKALTSITKINLKNIEVMLDYKTGVIHSQAMFNITVFDTNGSNYSFSFYKFSSLEQNQENLGKAINAIKADSFDKVKETKINH